MNSALLGLAARTPRLTDPVCSHHREVFDATIETSRGAASAEVRAARAMAQRHCAGCGDQPDCLRWLQSLEPHQRPTGVVAGLVISARGLPVR